MNNDRRTKLNNQIIELNDCQKSTVWRPNKYILFAEKTKEKIEEGASDE